MQRHVKVYARLRPPIHADEITNPQCLFCRDCTVTVCPPFANARSFTLDGVYGQDATSIDIYDSSLKSLLADFLDGYSCTCFVYGQTGSGKTYTMGFEVNSIGPLRGKFGRKEEGICGIFFNRLFHKLQYGTQRYNFTNSQVLLSMVQIYNDELEDLLLPHRRLSVREIGGSFHISNAACVSVSTAADAMQVVKAGLKNRTTAPTMMNKSSSRSHTVLCVALYNRVPGDRQSSHLFITSTEYLRIISGESLDPEQCARFRTPRAISANASLNKERKKSSISQLEKYTSVALHSVDDLHVSTGISSNLQSLFKRSTSTQLDPSIYEAVFYLCDLAGSERIKASKSDGIQLSEATHINQSLSVLSNVVGALSKQALGKKVSHVPYRDSMLTKLLKHSLAGESRMVAIVTVSPALTSLSETISTLMFAERCKNLPDWSKPKSFATDIVSVPGNNSSKINSRAIAEAYLSSIGVSLSKLEKHLPDVLLLINKNSSSNESKSKETIAILSGENARLRACVSSLIELPELPKVHTSDNKKSTTSISLRGNNKYTLNTEESLYTLLVNQCFHIDRLYRQIVTSFPHTRAGLALQQIVASYTKLCDHVGDEEKNVVVIDPDLSRDQMPEERFIEAIMRSELIRESIQVLYDQDNPAASVLLSDILDAHTNRLHREWTNLVKKTVMPPFSYFKDPERLTKFTAELCNTAEKELNRLENVFAGKQAEVDVLTAYANLALVVSKEVPTAHRISSRLTQSTATDNMNTSFISVSHPLSSPPSPTPQSAVSLSWLAELPPRPNSVSSDSSV